jgi:hypothetical protein
MYLAACNSINHIVVCAKRACKAAKIIFFSMSNNNCDMSFIF